MGFKRLNKSDVQFDQELHRYELNGVRLSGITDVLKRHLFPSEYDGVNEEVLENAKRKGTLVHEVCEIMDDLEVDNNLPEAKAYRELRERWGLFPEASEYLVSDNEHFASCIDKVYREGLNEFTLGDIKTTYKLNKNYVRWQLSIYAYLFEKQNPECKVVRLIAIWLRGDKGEITELERIHDSEIKRLLQAEVEGTKFTSNLPEYNENLPQQYRKIERLIVEVDTQKRYWDGERKRLMDGIKNEMDKVGAVSWKGDTIAFTRKKDSTRTKFDEEAFKADHEDLYKQYLVDVHVSGCVTMRTIKK